MQKQRQVIRPAAVFVCLRLTSKSHHPYNGMTMTVGTKVCIKLRLWGEPVQAVDHAFLANLNFVCRQGG